MQCDTTQGKLHACRGCGIGRAEIVSKESHMRLVHRALNGKSLHHTNILLRLFFPSSVSWTFTALYIHDVTEVLLPLHQPCRPRYISGRTPDCTVLGTHSQSPFLPRCRKDPSVFLGPSSPIATPHHSSTRLSALQPPSCVL